jgi:glutaredoxin
MKPGFLLGAFAALLAASASAQTYRWVDKDGKINYSDTPPPASAKSIQKRSPAGNVVETSQSQSQNQVPYATQQAVRNTPVTMYTAETCKQICDDARSFLAQRGVPFREVVVSDEASREALKKVSNGQEVPVLLVGRSATTGFGADSWNLALDAAGYPKSGPPIAQAPKPAVPAPKAEPTQAAQADPSAARGRYAPLPPVDGDAPSQTKGRYAPE